VNLSEEKVLITGKGQIGTSLKEELFALGATGIHIFDIDEMDITDASAVREKFLSLKPTLVFHTSALTKVDYCERNPEEAMRVNSEGTRNIVEMARQVGARLVYFSTDYVFPGKDDGEYYEDEEPLPLNAYGRSKLAGEAQVKNYEKGLIVRTAQVFAPNGRNFLAAIRVKLEKGEEIQVVSDEIATPTYAPHLARALLKLIPGAKHQIYHLRGSEALPYYEWAVRFAKLGGFRAELIQPVSAEKFPRDAPRPRRAVLSMQRFYSEGFPALPPLDVAMSDYIEKEKRQGAIRQG